MRNTITSLLWIAIFTLTGCSSGLPIRQDALPKFENTRTLSYSIDTVQKALASALPNPPKPESNTSIGTNPRIFTTDWTREQSRDKYILTQPNGVPKRKYLEIRYRYVIHLEDTPNGTLVKVEVSEQVESLNKNGESLGFSSTSKPDTSRGRDLLDRIQMAILRSP